MDAISTALTALVIVTGQGQQHWIPNSTTSPNPVDQARVIYAQQQRLEYLTSPEGRAYWREQLEIQKLKIPGEFRK
jgi:hypothetical protein